MVSVPKLVSDEVQWTLGRVDAKLEFITKLLEENQKKFNSLEERVQALEKKLWWAAGVAATVLFIWTIFSDGVLTKLGFK